MWFSRKQHGDGPKLLVDDTMAQICRGHILSIIPLDKIKEAVLTFIGSFYLLDADYPKPHELGLTVLHNNLLFEDKATPADLVPAFYLALQNYSKFKGT